MADCNKEYATAQKLREHNKNAHEQRRFVCWECTTGGDKAKSFSSGGSFWRHVMTQLKLKNYQIGYRKVLFFYVFFRSIIRSFKKIPIIQPEDGTILKNSDL